MGGEADVYSNASCNTLLLPTLHPTRDVFMLNNAANVNAYYFSSYNFEKIQRFRYDIISQNRGM